MTRNFGIICGQRSITCNVLQHFYFNVFRRGSTPVSTVLRKSVRFFIINTFLIIKNTFQVETWAICYLSDSKTQERGLKELNTKTFLGKPAPQTPLDSACAFGPRLGNLSVFIPDPRLVLLDSQRGA